MMTDFVTVTLTLDGAVNFKTFAVFLFSKFERHLFFAIEINWIVLASDKSFTQWETQIIIFFPASRKHKFFSQDSDKQTAVKNGKLMDKSCQFSLY